MKTGGWGLGYAFAKASGSLSRGFLAEGYEQLLRARDVRALVRLVYPGHPADLPESALVLDAEGRLDGRMDAKLERVFAYAGASARNFLRAALIEREADAAKARLREAAGPGSPGARPGYADMNRLDREARLQAWALLKDARGGAGDAARECFIYETRLRNAVWAIRLSVSFGMRVEEIEPLLVDLPGMDVKQAALEAAAFPADAQKAFMEWSLSPIVNPEGRGDFWKIDPVEVEARAEELIARKHKRAFRRSGLSVSALYCYVKLMAAESRTLLSAFEALRLGLRPEEALAPSAWRRA